MHKLVIVYAIGVVSGTIDPAMLSILSRLVDTNKKEVDKLTKIVEKINALEDKIKKLDIKDFPNKTEQLKDRIKKGEPLEALLPEAFALVREASYRVLGQRPYDVQLMAASALFEGKVAEQKTGEGKTLSAVPALYLRALVGKGVHLVTVNDYLARLGAGWNGPVFAALGLSVGVVVQEQKSFVFDPAFTDDSHGDERLAHLRPSTRQEAYGADVTYGTNNEFGFDYLRDNMVSSMAEMVQRGHYFAIVDEVDSVLIDEARTPLIISMPDREPTDKYVLYAGLIDKLNPDTDYALDEKHKAATLTEHGIAKVEKMLHVDNLYEKDFEAVHHIENALKARTLFLKDRDYVVKDNQIVIVDEFTGRLMVGRRWSDGLHQAVEAKEGVVIQQESKTLATISFQNYFRMYEVLSGMTGTAATEAEEFAKIYKIDVVVLPTHRPMVRQDRADAIYKTLRAKYAAIADDIEECFKRGQPVLVGTTSIEKNEIISSFLKKKKIPHNVLNAKNHEREAMIIAQAGAMYSVTVATNMAGRGVDIILGGAAPNKDPKESDDKYKSTKEYKTWKVAHDKVVALGGLHVIGTERHESRRIDNQLRGRAGRQGDPGSSRFYLSLEDDLMRIFGGEQIKSVMDRLSIPEDQPIENKLVSRVIEGAQIKVEGFYFDRRRDVVAYDDVENQQREIIYGLRRKVLASENLRDEIVAKLNKRVDSLVALGWSDTDGKNVEMILGNLLEIVPFDPESQKRVRNEVVNRNTKPELEEFLRGMVANVYESREKQLGAGVTRQLERFAYLGSIDHLWVDHIDRMEGLREGVGIRGRNDEERLAIFKIEGFEMFEKLVDRVDEELARRIFRIGVANAAPEIPIAQAKENIDKSDMTGLSEGRNTKKNVSLADSNSDLKKLGRNDPCWCGSGKKWKKCHINSIPQSGEEKRMFDLYFSNHEQWKKEAKIKQGK